VHDLKALSPLGGAAARVDTFAGLTISENADWALASISARLGRKKTMATAAKRLIGVDLPGVGTVAGKGDLSVFWTGPDQWMIEAPFGSHEDLATQTTAALKDTASVVEQTDGWVRFDVSGQGATDMFERLCAADTRQMDANTVSRATIEHLGCFVICRKNRVSFSVFGPRSSAGSLHHALCTAAKSAL
jgi:sarcosine oxidase subunit gamma